MAQIDVTALLTDPDFVDEMQLIRRSANVSGRGENMVKEVTTTSVGSVQPTDGKTLRRLPEALQQENLTSFWFNGEVPTTDGCAYPSVLVFKGKRFLIRHVFDWSNWGSGWSEGVCVAEKLT